MKTKLHKLISMAVLGVTLQMQSLPAWAGMADNYEVSILPDNSGASGTLTGARYSADSTQFIRCSEYYSSESFCEARDKSGKGAYCFSTDPKFIAAVNAMTDSSYISFRIVPGVYQCTELVVNNSSTHLR